MELKFLGTGNSSTNKNTSAYFIVEDTMYLIDCGETVYHEIVELKIIEKECPKRVIVVITHTHADHIGSLLWMGLPATAQGVPS